MNKHSDHNHHDNAVNHSTAEKVTAVEEVAAVVEAPLAVNPLAVTAASEEKAPRRKSVFNIEANRLEVTEPDGTSHSFDMDDLPADMQVYCKFLGAWTFIRAAEDVKTGFEKLILGDLPEKAPKIEKLSPWKMAVAHALVHDTKDSEKAYTLADAVALPQIREMDRKQIEKARMNPLVVFYHNKLTQKESSSVLDLATATA